MRAAEAPTSDAIQSGTLTIWPRIFLGRGIFGRRLESLSYAVRLHPPRGESDLLGRCARALEQGAVDDDLCFLDSVFGKGISE
jgi:hypothetical protein